MFLVPQKPHMKARINSLTDYQSYIQSEAWKAKAKQRLEIDGYQCVMCGAQGTAWNPLNVHHRNYKSIGHENVDTDLVTLCDPCHRRVHRLLHRITDHRTGKRGWTDELPLLVQKHVYELCGERYTVTDPKELNGKT